jgi:dTDP-4-amino-4,6-dideoxygalactose transaminase
VHFAGQPTDQSAIWDLARDYGFRVLEDASHAVGASRSGEPVGSCRWSDITVLSFHPVKIITSGEGGAALTNDPLLAERMMMLRTHGITRDPKRFHDRDPAPWHYEQQLLGFNYRMTDIHATLGVSQLARLSAYVDRRNVLAARYDLALRGLRLQLPTVRPENRSAYHLYVVRMTAESAGRAHRQVFSELRRRGIGANLHYTPVHLQPYYRQLGFNRGQFPQAEAYAETALTLPLYPTLTESEQDSVVAALQAAL